MTAEAKTDTDLLITTPNRNGVDRPGLQTGQGLGESRAA